MQVMRAHARIARDTAAGARRGDLHPSAALTAAHQSLQQRAALARRAAALAGLDHVAAQPLAGGQIIVPGHIAGMVLGDADRPLLDRQLDLIRDTADTNRVVTFGFFEGTLDDLQRSQDEHGYDERRAAADAFVADVLVNGVFDVVVDMKAA